MLKPNQYSLFYNTIGEKGVELSQSKTTSKTQQEQVYEYFRIYRRATTCQVQRALKMNLYSVRRSVTNLAEAGKLVKTKETVIEEYGKANFIYRIA